MNQADFLSRVAEVGGLLGAAPLTPRRIHYWAGVVGGRNWRGSNLRLSPVRLVTCGLHMLMAWHRIPHNQPSFAEYVAHRAWAVAGCAGTIDPDAHALLRELFPRPTGPLRMFGLDPTWNSSLSEYRRRERAAV